MPKTAQLEFQEIDNSAQVGDISQNISGVIYDAEMGPINDPKDIINTSSQFNRIFGGIKPNNSNEKAYNACIRALERGTALRVANVKNYTNIDDKATVSATKADVTGTPIHTLNHALVAGQSLVVTVGGLSKTFPFSGSAQKTIEQIFTWLKGDWAVALNLNGPVIYTERMDDTHLIIIPNDRTANVTISATGTGSLPTITTPTSTDVTNSSGENLFSFVPKYAGAKYNDLLVLVQVQSAIAKTFKVTVFLLNSTREPEEYTDLFISSNTDTTYLNKIALESELIEPVYMDTTNNIGLPFINGTFPLLFTGGSDGLAVSANDIIGSSISKTGFNAFDGYDDVARVANMIDLTDNDAINIAGAAYAASRTDLTYHFTIAGINKDTIIAKRNSLGINTSYARVYSAGEGILIKDKRRVGDLLINPIGDELGIAAYSADKFGPWYSYANVNRGALLNVKSAKNGWGASGNEKDLNDLAEAQINAIITQDKSTMIWGNFSLQIRSSLLSYNSIRDLLIYIKKSLRPTLRPFLEEPNDIATWILIYNAIHPFFSGLSTKRALYPEKDGGWVWNGDQNASSMRNLTVNNLNDVQQGKYKVILELKPINSLQQFTLAISLNSADQSISISEI